VSGLLTPEAAIAYWDRRHRQQGDLRSGGDIGLDEGTNEIFYAIRLGKLLDIIGHDTSVTEPLFALDAGCGKGFFSEALARCGHGVVGIDTSEHAITSCRADGRAEYEVSSLAGYRSPWLFDVVYAVDVLFHILDDAEWEASLRNLASLVRLSGQLVVTDEDNDEAVRRGNYIVHRARADYRCVADDCGLEFRDFRPYGFRDNRIGFHVFARTR
jgi:2-polyprenyl-3-methyl-5-hydroxy-6-metoxy-1,4-benzoquinol methylase